MLSGLFTSRSIATLSTIALLTLTTGCSPRRATAIVLWVDTDIPVASFGTVTVTVTGIGPNGSSTMYTGSVPHGASAPWPGSVVLVPNANKNVESVDVVLNYVDRMGGGFQQRARAVFARNEWRQLSMLIANQCNNAAVQAQCTAMSAGGQEFTCGSADPNNPCVPVVRESLPTFDQEAGTPPEQPRTDIGPVDDSAADVPTIDATVMDVPNVDPATIDPPTLLWPPTGARIRGTQPMFHVGMTGRSTQADIELCTEPDCSVRLTPPFRIGTTLTAAPAGLIQTAETIWWRAYGVEQGVRGTRASRIRRLITTPGTMGMGHVIGRLADFNNDGYGDFAVGRPGRRNVRAGLSGSVDIVLSSPMQGSIQTVADTLMPAAPTVGEHFGASITSCDFDGDNIDDVAVGAPGTALDNIVGHVYVYRGVGNGTFQRMPLTILTAPVAGDLFGHSLASGDMDGDGKCELIVGSPKAIAGAVIGAGHVSIFRGGTLTLARSLDGAQFNEAFGASIAAGGDLNGDGFEDLVIGAPGANGGNGKALVWLSSDDPTLVRGTATLTPGMTIPEAMSYFGYQVSILGDVNGDNFTDIGISAPLYGDNEGAGYVALGQTDFVNATPTPITAAPGLGRPVQFGWNITGLGSVDRDDHDDIFLGAPAVGANGAAEIIRCFRCANQSTLVLQGTVSGSMFGFNAVALGNMDTAFIDDDFVISAPFAEDPALNASPLVGNGVIQLYTGRSAADPVIHMPGALGTLTDPAMTPAALGEWGAVFNR